LFGEREGPFVGDLVEAARGQGHGVGDGEPRWWDVFERWPRGAALIEKMETVGGTFDAPDKAKNSISELTS